MSVYVDEIKPCIKNSKWRYSKSCHLFADTLGELHNAAELIGLKKEWFQNHPRHPHYDLTENKRKQAVLYGALQVTNWYRTKVIEQINN